MELELAQTKLQLVEAKCKIQVCGIQGLQGSLPELKKNGMYLYCCMRVNFQNPLIVCP